MARQLGGLRIKQLCLTGLGDANLAAGNLEAAESAFIESLATSEQMGLVREMLGLLTKIAKVRVAAGDRREAAELLATVLAEPTSSQHVVFESASIAEIASATLADSQEQLDPEDYSMAHAAGTARFYGIAVKEMIESTAELARVSPT